MSSLDVVISSSDFDELNVSHSAAISRFHLRLTIGWTERDLPFKDVMNNLQFL
jgi:hypothetical protein